MELKVWLIAVLLFAGCALRPCSRDSVAKLNYKFRNAVTLKCNDYAPRGSYTCNIPRFHGGRHHFHYESQCLLTWRDRPVPKHLRGR